MFIPTNVMLINLNSVQLFLAWQRRNICWHFIIICYCDKSKQRKVREVTICPWWARKRVTFCLDGKSLKFENVGEVYCWPHVKLRINKSYYCSRRAFSMGCSHCERFNVFIVWANFSNVTVNVISLFVVSRFSSFWGQVWVCACVYVVLFDWIQDNSVCSAEKTRKHISIPASYNCSKWSNKNGASMVEEMWSEMCTRVFSGKTKLIAKARNKTSSSRDNAICSNSVFPNFPSFFFLFFVQTLFCCASSQLSHNWVVTISAENPLCESERTKCSVGIRCMAINKSKHIVDEDKRRRRRMGGWLWNLREGEMATRWFVYKQKPSM